MKFTRPITALAASVAALALFPAASALAQRQPPPTPDQRLERLERQLQQVQRQVFPRGRPADTAGFSNEPAATQSSVTTLDQRLDALERQMADLLRQSEENGHRLQTLQSDMASARSNQDQRISAIEQRIAEAATVVQPPVAEPATPATLPPRQRVETSTPSSSTGAAAEPEGDPAEEAYSEGFHLWEDGQYDAAIASLRTFAKSYPKHRRTSYANNLVGRAMLDKGDARGAAAALLANYRSDPKGERAPDSLFYLGQALMKLGQPGQACKAYAELDAVYGSSIRPDLRKLETAAKSEAQCS